jgi:hypothetical protein
MNSKKQDVYTSITDKIIADLEQGVRTWMKPGTQETRRGGFTLQIVKRLVQIFSLKTTLYPQDCAYSAACWHSMVSQPKTPTRCRFLFSERIC